MVCFEIVLITKNFVEVRIILKGILSIQKSFEMDKFFESYAAENASVVVFFLLDSRVDSLETADFALRSFWSDFFLWALGLEMWYLRPVACLKVLSHCGHLKSRLPS